ncbi:MAG: sigma-54-dependent Fis family transcriptional regulator [Polyangiaceae bacterium]|nr:sigma-54-dependent Fis family transcriptional regulator [Polyangiaceae bacterium]
MEHLRRQLLGLARCDDTVLIHGPTGVGKERAALALHRWGPRSGGRFVAVHCAAIPEPLVESELFGHAKGAFSGAGAARRGLIEEADGGTLFLDEIGDLSLPTQAKLLRVLQDHRLRPVGSSDEIAVDVRIVAATNRELLADLEAGRFRADLYGRLEGFRVEVPALSARREDIPVLLAQFFAARVAASDDAARWVRPANEFAPPIPLAFALGLLAREWPRNVRELERTVASIAVASERARVFTAPADEAPHEPPAAGHARPGAEELRRLLDEHEYVSHRVARALGVSTTTIDRWMREHAIVRPRDLGADALTAALDAADGDPARAARALSVSLRGLKLRLRELGLTREDSR